MVAHLDSVADQPDWDGLHVSSSFIEPLAANGRRYYRRTLFATASRASAIFSATRSDRVRLFGNLTLPVLAPWPVAASPPGAMPAPSHEKYQD
jgi:hypothetical protein